MVDCALEWVDVALFKHNIYGTFKCIFKVEVVCFEVSILDIFSRIVTVVCSSFYHTTPRFSSSVQENLPKIASKLENVLLKCKPMAKRIEPSFSVCKRGTSRKSNAPSTISLAHTKHAICGSKVASWTQNS